MSVPPNRVLQFLHDPPSMIMRSPVVFAFHELPSKHASAEDPSPLHERESKYLITDSVPIFFGLLNTKPTVLATFNPSQDGTCMSVEAAAGTRLRTVWTAVENVDGGTVLSEVVEITGFILLMPFIMSTMRESQRQSFETLVTRVKEQPQ
ncbi:hypothetical protein FIBSPDRAFT_1054151 [Athelia psychrophila]|uniref:DUF7053 domain-containing protein n=1 Tax=Athelia psychrophila TaxID=1759441 RepID=A0A167VS38_9AGAM|nr:hypothetical protein FIBSPDRAFT_1054151 [Fibularhizoctonia sp. CBS 109695]